MVPTRRTLACAALCALAVGPRPAGAQQPLDREGYVAIVLSTHPVVGQRMGLDAAAAAERRAVRLWPDPVVAFSAAKGRPADGLGGSGAETEVSISQVFPWRRTFSAGVRAGDAAATALLANAEGLRWELIADARAAFAQLASARAFVDIARATEADARSLRDLVISRTELGEARESDRIKATVEWMRQQRNLASAERAATSAETIVRALAGGGLPRPLVVVPLPRPPAWSIRDDFPVVDLVSRNPRVQVALAEAERQRALLSAATSGRVPDLGMTLFRNAELDEVSTGVSLDVTVPLWNANRGQIARAQASMLTSSAEVQRARVDLATEFEARLRDLHLAAGQVAVLEGAILPAAHRSVELARFSFEEGETSLLDLLDAQRTFRDTQREAVDAHAAVWLAQAEAQRLVGPDFTPWK